MRRLISAAALTTSAASRVTPSSFAAAAGNVTATPAFGMAGVVQHRGGDRTQPRCHVAVLGRVAAPFHLRQQHAQLAQRTRAAVGAQHESGRRREERADVRRGQGGEHGAAARGQLRGQPHTHVGDQGRAAGRPLLDHVQHLPPVHDRQVRAVPRLVGQVRQRHAGEPLQRLLADVAGAELVGADAEPVAPVVGEVHHEAGGDQLAQQVIGRRPGQAQVAGDGAGRYRPRLPRQVPQDRQHLARGGNVGHGVLDTRQDEVSGPSAKCRAWRDIEG